MDGKNTLSVCGTLGLTRGVVFELGDVIHDATLWRRRLCRLCTTMHLAAPYPYFLETWDRDYLPALHRGRIDLRSALKQYLAAAGLRRAQVDEATAAALADRRLLDETDRPFPTVRSAIARLHRTGYGLVLFANCSRSREGVERQLQQLGLAGCFEAVIASTEVGAAFPDPIAYRAALSAIGLPAGRTAVFAATAAGVAGAAAIRCPTIAFSHVAAAADIVVDSFSELPCRLDAWFDPPLRRSA